MQTAAHPEPPVALDPDVPAHVVLESEEIMPLNVVVVYGDAAAGKHALRVLRRLGAHLHAQAELKPVLWRFDLLADPRWRAIATDDAAAAGLILIAAGETDMLPDPVNAWLKESLARKQGRPVAVLTLFGDDHAWAVWMQDQRQICTKRECLSTQLIPPPVAGDPALVA